MPILVRLNEISKRFPGGVQANNNVSIKARGGEVHGILGENGAGKTTLMRILAGLYRPDSGYVEIDGSRRDFYSPVEAKQAGVGMVHQHFSLVPALTVAENLALTRTDAPFLLRPKHWRRHLQETADRLGFDIRPTDYVWRLSVGERQKVEIFRLIMEGAKILILDEPTSILVPQEAELLFQHIRRFAEMGHVVFLITHKIHHVRAIASQVTVLRRGVIVGSSKVEDLNDHELAELMVGKSLAEDFDKRPARETVPGEEALFKIRELSVRPTFSPCGISDVSFELRPGEILAVAGVSGNGQDELAAAITGMVEYEGTIEFSQASSLSGHKRRLGYIPADRRGMGLALPLSIRDNLALRKYPYQPFSAGGFIRDNVLYRFAREKISEFAIQPDIPSARAAVMSGGNIQKVVVARELDEHPAIVVAVNPTAGLDVATVQRVHEEILRQVEGGTGFLLVSEDLDELLLLCDRILVFYKGRMVDIFEIPKATRKEIGLAMSGLRSDQERTSEQAMVVKDEG